MPPKTFDDKELKRLLKGYLLTIVLDVGQGAREKVGRKMRKVVDSIARVVFWERVGMVSSYIPLLIVWQ